MAGELTEKAVSGGKATVSETLSAGMLGTTGGYVSDPGGSHVAFRTLSEKYGEIWLAEGERIAGRGDGCRDQTCSGCWRSR